MRYLQLNLRNREHTGGRLGLGWGVETNRKSISVTKKRQVLGDLRYSIMPPVNSPAIPALQMWRWRGRNSRLATC